MALESLGLTVEELRKALADLPGDATVHAYEGEGIGIIVRVKDYDWEKPDDENNKSWWFDTEPA